ncbi:farnesol dehydrogenase-like [Colletes gigas]|uniref:farnesol dehydrogenase-like n=1 Tax=Colletes gigas TaxID=935657 RepID=UPI001C9A4C12|nr:farnesol dehydrogenase-like [Colletes gigas]
MERWAGKVAIVTGASTGIGAAIARSLVDNDVKVVGLARRMEKLQEVAGGLKKGMFHSIVCDVRKEEDILKAFEWTKKKFGGADILVNNAGVATQTSIIDTPTEEYRKIIDINVIAPAICAREFIQSIKERNGAGHIINISSLAGRHAECVKIPMGMYCASKYALNALTTELRHEIIYNKLNIKITIVSPGAVLTDMLKDIVKSDAILNNLPALKETDIADGVIYTLKTPQGAEVHDMLIMPQNTLLNFDSNVLP